MKKDKRYLLSITYLIIGIILIGLSLFEKVDSFWSGMGSGLFTVSILQLIRFYRFNNNEEYRKKIELEENDERNHFIRNKAWAWAGYILVIILAIFTIVFKIVEQDLLSMASSTILCLVLILYWIFFLVLKNKY